MTSRHEPDLCPHCPGDGCEHCRSPIAPRCAYCGSPWPRAGKFCDQKCSASYAEMMATFAAGGCTPEERDLADAVEAAMTNAAEQAAAVERWRTGRN